MTTKFLPVAALIALAATSASAQNMFGIISQMDQGTYIDVNVPNVTQDGYLAAYAMGGPNDGELIGYTMVRSGPAVDERIRFGSYQAGDVMVYLFGGEPFQPISEAIDQVRISIDND